MGGFGPGLDDGRKYAKVAVWIMVGAFVCWFLYAGLTMATGFMN